MNLWNGDVDWSEVDSEQNPVSDTVMTVTSLRVVVNWHLQKGWLCYATLRYV